MMVQPEDNQPVAAQQPSSEQHRRGGRLLFGTVVVGALIVTAGSLYSSGQAPDDEAGQGFPVPGSSAPVTPGATPSPEVSLSPSAVVTPQVTPEATPTVSAAPVVKTESDNLVYGDSGPAVTSTLNKLAAFNCGGFDEAKTTLNSQNAAFVLVYLSHAGLRKAPDDFSQQAIQDIVIDKTARNSIDFLTNLGPKYGATETSCGSDYQQLKDEYFEPADGCKTTDGRHVSKVVVVSAGVKCPTGQTPVNPTHTIDKPKAPKSVAPKSTGATEPKSKIGTFTPDTKSIGSIDPKSKIGTFTPN